MHLWNLLFLAFAHTTTSSLRHGAKVVFSPERARLQNSSRKAKKDFFPPEKEIKPLIKKTPLSSPKTHFQTSSNQNTTLLTFT
jgi:hypothetical protein